MHPFISMCCPEHACTYQVGPTDRVRTSAPTCMRLQQEEQARSQQEEQVRLQQEGQVRLQQEEQVRLQHICNMSAPANGGRVHASTCVRVGPCIIYQLLCACL